MNEVLDALPPSIVVRADDEWREQGVVMRDDGTLALSLRPLADARLAALAAARFPAGDYTSEINPAAEALVEDVARRLAVGAMLVIDYGFPRAEYYHPQRATGTLMAHYRHRAHGDPLRWPGLTDLTAHVDFTAIAEAGERAGLSVAGFASQAAFLLATGLLDRLAEVGPPETAVYLREAAAVQTLTSPAEMGELFKVLALARSADIAWPGFRAGRRDASPVEGARERELETPIAFDTLALGRLPERHARYRPRHTAVIAPSGERDVRLTGESSTLYVNRWANALAAKALRAAGDWRRSSPTRSSCSPPTPALREARAAAVPLSPLLTANGAVSLLRDAQSCRCCSRRRTRAQCSTPCARDSARQDPRGC